MQPKKSKTDDLARIRNNQRRCRERRREYIAELELKLKHHGEEMLQYSTELQNTTQNLLCENKILKGLLESSGTCQNSQSQNLTIDTQPKTFQGEERLRANVWALLTGQQQLQLLGTEPPNIPFDFVDCPLMSSNSNATELDVPGSVSTYDLEADILSPSPETPWPVLTNETAREDRTMLCSVAYRLISQFNKRQYDDSKVDLKVRCGFRLGRTPSEGCRVDNEVLFAFLAEISS